MTFENDAPAEHARNRCPAGRESRLFVTPDRRRVLKKQYAAARIGASSWIAANSINCWMDWTCETDAGGDGTDASVNFCNWAFTPCESR
jgi:hypothetical protein